MLNALLSNAYTVALAVPLILLLSGSLAKKVVRGSAWEQSDFFLGIEATLAAMSSGLVYLFELAKVVTTPPATPTPLPILVIPSPKPLPTPINPAMAAANKLTVTAVFVALTFFLLFWVLATHQDWEKSTVDPKKQFWRLCIFANCIGLGLMSAFILVVKGVE